MMKTYKCKSKHYGFQLSIPDGWSGSLAIDLLENVPNTVKYRRDSSGKATDSRTIVGPDGKYLTISITPLSENEPEPTIDETDEYFDGLAYRQSLHVIATGTINIANKEHFWATYYRMTLIGQSQIRFFKKYCLFLNRTEYLITAGLWSVLPGDKLPTDQMLEDSEKVYDEIVSSFELSSD